MKRIDGARITEAVYKLFKEAVCGLPEDVLNAIIEARARETGASRFALDQIIKNEAMARQASRPVCQDTGLAIVFMDVGRNVLLDCDVNEAVNQGVREAYEMAYLRKSCLGAVDRLNTMDNTPAILHVRFVNDDGLVRLTAVPKGFGSENMSALKMLSPSDGIEGALEFIVDTARKGAANACPPVILGVCIGGDFEKAAIESKRALLRPLGSVNDSLKSLEQEALNRINALNIGPMGLGGKTTALGVHIEQIPTHLAGLPVAVNVQCHCSRHATLDL